MSGGSEGSERSRPSWLLRHPREVLALGVVALLALVAIGTGVNGRLDPTTLDIPGTASERANSMLEEHFGDSAPFAILLRGPADAIEEQGPRLIRALRRDPKVTTLSPWDRGSVERLRPAPDRALILADFHVDTKTAVNDTVPRLERLLEREVEAPVRVTQTGYASLSRAIQEESIDAAERGELIALPILLLVLLIVFRSPIAAAIPLVFGALTVFASRGVLYFATSWFDIDAFALTVCTMMGLALGVDYALLMVSRFREELANGLEPLAAARATRRTAGRTVAFAGSTLLLSMLVSLLVLPGSLLASLAGTVAMVVALSVVVANLLVPAVLTLVGTGVDRFRIGPAPGGRSRLMALVGAALRRPVLAALLIGAVLLALAAPTLGLKTGPPSPEQLASDAPARQDAELIDRVIGPGWDAPFQIVVTNPRGPITAPASLTALDGFQRRVADLPGVQAVVGPSRVAKQVKPLQEFGDAALASRGNIGPVKRFGKLGRSLRVAAGGVGTLRSGLDEASRGAGLLAQGSDRAEEGATLITHGLTRSARGSARAIVALEKFAAGSRKLEEAELQAAIAGSQLRAGIQVSGGANLRRNGLRRQKNLLRRLRAETGSSVPRLLATPSRLTVERLQTALAQVNELAAGQADPRYAAASQTLREALALASGTDPVTGFPVDPETGAPVPPPTPTETEPEPRPEYLGLPGEVGELERRLGEDSDEAKTTAGIIRSTLKTIKRSEEGAVKLKDGLYRIHKSGHQLAAGAARLSRASRTLGNGIERLRGGTEALAVGIARLTGGAEALEASLATGAEKSAPLEAGLTRASVQVVEGRAKIRHRATRIREQTPGLFNSGYFVLSALDGAPKSVRRQAANAIDLERGGSTSVILVIPKYTFNTPGSIDLNRRLDSASSHLAKRAGLETGVAGGVARLNDYSRVTRDRIPIVVAAITLVTFLVLVWVLRALLLAAIAVGLNLLTVGVAFGVLTLLFHVPAGTILGGHHYVDAVGATAIFGIVFGLSIDYAVFLLSRMREHYDATGDNAAAVDFGLQHTARVITGAAAIMLAVFVVFAGAPIATVSQLGVGLTVAVVLDATVVRIVLLPALMLLLGDRVWWLPRSLDRALPRLSV